MNYELQGPFGINSYFDVGQGGVCLELVPKSARRPKTSRVPRKPLGDAMSKLAFNRGSRSARVSNSAIAASKGTFPGSKKPNWVEYDRKVLRFYMYFKEAVTESDVENFRVRKCVLYFYLTDGTVHIAEPKVENSGKYF